MVEKNSSALRINEKLEGNHDTEAAKLRKNFKSSRN